MTCPEIVYTLGQQIAGSTLLTLSLMTLGGVVAFLMTNSNNER
jgi:hypothetical protein